MKHESLDRNKKSQYIARRISADTHLVCYLHLGFLLPSMAGAFSGHLVNSFYNPGRTPFSQFSEDISINGPMSFNPSMHGGSTTPRFSPSMMGTPSASMMSDISDDTAMRIASLQAKLDKKLGPEYISQRPGPGGAGKLTYAEGWKIINLANEAFGFNGWSTHIVNLTTDYADFSEETRRYSVGVTAIIKGLSSGEFR